MSYPNCSDIGDKDEVEYSEGHTAYPKDLDDAESLEDKDDSICRPDTDSCMTLPLIVAVTRGAPKR